MLYGYHPKIMQCPNALSNRPSAHAFAHSLPKVDTPNLTSKVKPFGFELIFQWSCLLSDDGGV